MKRCGWPTEITLPTSTPAGEFAILVRIPMIDGTPLAPDLNNPETRIFEWSPTVGD